MERDNKIEELLRRRVPKIRIARELGITPETVDRVAARIGLPASRRRKTGVDWPEIRHYYDAGHTAAACQRRFGVSASSWRAAIARGDLVPRPREHAQQLPGKTRREVKRLLDQGLRQAEVARRLGIKTSTVSYHARQLGIPPKSEFGKRFDWEEIRRTYEAGLSRRECQRRFGCSSDSWRRAIERGDIVPRDHRIPLDQLLVKGRRTSRGHLKDRLIGAELKENRCEECEITEWNGRPLNMELHHVNGDGTDNRLENLRFLCGNCHAQTHSWGGRNVARAGRPDLKLIEGGGESDEEAPELREDDEVG